MTDHIVIPGAKNHAGGKLITVDILRGLAALTVFTYHYQLGRNLSKAFGLPELQYLDAIGSTFAVPLFFLLSGFCIHRSEIAPSANRPNANLAHYARRRFFRIYPPYLVALFFSVCILSLQGETVSSPDFTSHATLTHGFFSPYFNTINLVLWTISIEAVLYLAYPLWALVRNKLSLKAALLLSGVTSLTSITWVALSDVPLGPSGTWFVGSLWFGWTVGAAISDLWNRSPKVFDQWLWPAASLGLATVTVIIWRAEYWPEFAGAASKLALILNTVWVLLLALKAERLIQLAASSASGRFILAPAAALGTMSYSLYLTHMPFISTYLLLSSQMSDQLNPELRYATGFAFVLAGSACFYALFERPAILISRPKVVK